MYDVVAFGEGMIRLSPGHFKRLEQAENLDLHVAGAELNVAVGCSRLGLRAAWVSKLPDNPLGRMVRNKAREQGVATDHICWSGGRVGLYFLEFGATPRNSSVLYDRRDSAFSSIQPGELNWGEILGAAKCLHVTGITPALGASAAEVNLEAMKTAKKLGCQVSLDLNYRSKLWSPDEAKNTILPLMPYVDILIATAGDSRTMLDVAAPNDEELALKLEERFSCEVIAISHREGNSLCKCRWSGLAHCQGQTVVSRVYDVDIVDQVGRGDAFAAGFLAGYIPKRDISKGLDYAVAYSALKHSMPGDISWCDACDVETLLADSTAPRVNR